MKLTRLFVIRAYCSDCKKLLMESNPLTRKELTASWDKAVIDAANIPCKDCGNNPPNFHIDLKIYSKGSRLEFSPRFILPKPKYSIDDLPWFMKHD